MEKKTFESYIVAEGNTMAGKSMSRKLDENTKKMNYFLAVCHERDVENSGGFNRTAMWEPKLSKTILTAQGFENFIKILASVGIELPSTVKHTEKDVNEWVDKNQQWIVKGKPVEKKLVLVFTLKHGDNDKPFRANNKDLYLKKPKLIPYKDNQDGYTFAYKSANGYNLVEENNESTTAVYSFYSLEDNSWPNVVFDDTIYDWAYGDIDDVTPKEETAKTSSDTEKRMDNLENALANMAGLMQGMMTLLQKNAVVQANAVPANVEQR